MVNKWWRVSWLWLVFFAFKCYFEMVESRTHHRSCKCQWQTWVSEELVRLPLVNYLHSTVGGTVATIPNQDSWAGSWRCLVLLVLRTWKSHHCGILNQNHRCPEEYMILRNMILFKCTANNKSLILLIVMVISFYQGCSWKKWLTFLWTWTLINTFWLGRLHPGPALIRHTLANRKRFRSQLWWPRKMCERRAGKTLSERIKLLSRSPCCSLWLIVGYGWLANEWLIVGRL